MHVFKNGADTAVSLLGYIDQLCTLRVPNYFLTVLPQSHWMENICKQQSLNFATDSYLDLRLASC